MALAKNTTAKGSTGTYASVWDVLADNKEQPANLRARSQLMQQIAEVVKDSGWNPLKAATRCGITQPPINDLLRGRVSRFSIDSLVNIAAALGRTVHFELHAAWTAKSRSFTQKVETVCNEPRTVSDRDGPPRVVMDYRRPLRR